MNKNIVLLAETGSDITPEIAAKYGIYIVPMHVQMGDITKDDGSFPPEEVCEYYEKTGIKVGFKPAGGISTTKEAVEYYTIVRTVLGEEWMTNELFRFGASRLANNLLTSIYGTEVKYF